MAVEPQDEAGPEAQISTSECAGDKRRCSRCLDRPHGQGPLAAPAAELRDRAGGSQQEAWQQIHRRAPRTRQWRRRHSGLAAIEVHAAGRCEGADHQARRQGLGAAKSRLRYLEREGTTREGGRGTVNGAEHDTDDGKAFLERGQDDRHQFRFIVAPEDVAEFDDLKPFVRSLMHTMEQDLGTGSPRSTAFMSKAMAFAPSSASYGSLRELLCEADLAQACRALPRAWGALRHCR